MLWDASVSAAGRQIFGRRKKSLEARLREKKCEEKKAFRVVTLLNRKHILNYILNLFVNLGWIHLEHNWNWIVLTLYVLCIRWSRDQLSVNTKTVHFRTRRRPKAFTRDVWV